jgi:hypothetical protein
MDQQQQQQRQDQLNINRALWFNGMDEYERVTSEWNQSIEVQERREDRNRMINNTAGYHRGNEVHHLRSIQMHDPNDWNTLFGNEILNPVIREYAQESMDWVQDDTRILPFAGQMEVSLLMQDNYRPGVHAAIFFVYLIPHRKFHDGHMIQIEFSEGSNTHQNINRLFDTNTRAVVSQATQYQMLGFLADDNEAMDLLYSCFLDDDFNPRRYSYVVVVPMPENENFDNGEEDYEYIVDPNANNELRWHDEFYHDERRPRPPRLQLEDDVVAEVAPVVAAIPPPPPPVNDIAAIFHRNLALYDENIDNANHDYYINNIINYNEDQDQDQPDIHPQRNIMQYIYNDGEDDGVGEDNGVRG